MIQLEIDQLTYHYPGSESPALHEVSIKIDRGEFVAITGANNSGKSTLCYALAGVIPHLYHGRIEGQVLIGGQDNKDKTVSEIARHVGLVLQIPGSQMSGVRYTVFEEVAFGLENRGVPREQMLERVQTILALFGLEEHATRSPFHLSGGQQQRLALATVLAVDPAIIVLDEPTTFLDPQGAKLVFEILHKLQQQGKTIIIAEQRLDMIAHYADRVLAFDKARLVLDGSPREVLTSAVLPDIKLKYTRYTQVAQVLRQKGLWPEKLPLPASLTETVDGLSQLRKTHDHLR
jgi:energy-coupling factor transporter ATP-binding protein EcfA2